MVSIFGLMEGNMKVGGIEENNMVWVFILIRSVVRLNMDYGRWENVLNGLRTMKLFQ